MEVDSEVTPAMISTSSNADDNSKQIGADSDDETLKFEQDDDLYGSDLDEVDAQWAKKQVTFVGGRLYICMGCEDRLACFVCYRYLRTEVTPVMIVMVIRTRADCMYISYCLYRLYKRDRTSRSSPIPSP